MKLDDTLECVEEIVEMLTVTRDSLTDVLVQETSLLELSKEKLKGCLLNIEKIIGILRNDSPYENFVKPLHQGLSRSMDCLDGTVSESGGSLSGSRSTSNLAENFDMRQNTAPNSPTSYNETETVESINSPKLRLENSNKKTTVALPLSPVENTNNMKINLPLRKATKRRVKVLRWLKKAFLGEETQNVAVIGDIYKLEAPNNNRVKLWCMVRNRVLYCYRNIMNETIDMEIPLDSCRAFAETNSPGGSYAFSIHKGDEKLCTFVANTARERERWMEIVRNRRGTVFLGEFCEDCENGENGESDQSSGTEAEDITEDEGGYVVMERNTSVESSDSESDYAEPYDEAVCNTLTCEECGNDDSGYVSVIALEYEVKRRRSSKESKFNPNVTSKSDLRNLTKKDNPIQTNFLSAAALAKTQPRNKERSPAPLPRIVTNQKIMSRQNDRVDGIGGLEIDTKPKEKITEEIAAEEKMESNLGSEAVVYDDSVAQQSTVTATGNQNPGGLLVESHMTATSSLKDSPANQGKFGQRGGAGMTGCWRPEVNDKSQYLEIDLEKITCVGAIGIQGRPNYDENGGEFVKSYTLHYSTDRDKWMPYKRSGKTKVFRGNSSPNQEKKKILKHVISARYFRVYSESWHNHIALRVGLYRPQQGKEKKCEKSGELSPTKTGPLERKKVILRKEISGPGSAPLTENITPKHDQTFLDSSTDVTNTTKETSGTSTIGTQSLEGRVKLRETLLVKEKKEQIVVLENLKKQMNYAKDKMIVVNNSNQTKSEAIDTKEEYLTINLEVVKVKKRLQEIETELRDLRLFISHQREQQQQHERPKILSKPARPPMIRRPSKEIKVCTTAVSPVVDREAFNPPAAEPPVRKVMDNVKMFENLQGR